MKEIDADLIPVLSLLKPTGIRLIRIPVLFCQNIHGAQKGLSPVVLTGTAVYGLMHHL